MPVSTNERERSAPAAVDTPARPGNCEGARSHQAAQLDVWEDEGGGPNLQVTHTQAPAGIEHLA
jgi:hypothetical protein